MSQSAHKPRTVMGNSLRTGHLIPGNDASSVQTRYRRTLPVDTIAFSSSEGRGLFAEALAAKGMSGYFPLAEQFHTQADPSYCGLGSLVMALNALGIDPERTWKGTWRWFTEDLLDCCMPLSEIREHGLSIDQVACLARCNGAEVEVTRADETNVTAWRAALQTAANGNGIVVASYDRAAVGQTGSGHFSPIGGCHESRDLTLILDVARFKYPAHWVSAEQLWRAMQPADAATGRARGWMTLRRRAQDGSRSFNANCGGLNSRLDGLPPGTRRSLTVL
jgi:glutathione gamma-glutamylcysteinyltransferase